MEQLNKIELRGNIGNVRLSQNTENNVVNFSVATTYVYKDRNGEAVIETTWHNITAWKLKGMPDFEFLTRGTPVHVVGRLRTNRYTGSDGVERYSYDVVASSIEILDEQLTMQAGY
ncbi:MAG: single-stranded DNA-binding protein [Bacteroidales bacterium]|nr:single-stranded DNA-binding protein [Bacteroidales bacterium]